MYDFPTSSEVRFPNEIVESEQKNPGDFLLTFHNLVAQKEAVRQVGSLAST